jgi:transglutaminase-like putative cysteine protease
VALVQGALLATIALLMGVIQQRATRRDNEIAGADPSPSRVRRAWIGTAGLATSLAVVAVTAPILGPRLPLAAAHERYDLRSQSTPPWNPLAVPSPLVQLKASLAEEHRDDVVFTAHADQPIARWQVATLGDYDGVVWTVASAEDSSAAGEFRPVDTRLPRAPSSVRGRDTVSATVTVADLRDPWLPTPGWPSSLHIDQPDGPVRANLRTGTVALADGIRKGLTYDVSAYVPPTLTDGELTNAGIDTLSDSDALDGLPPPVKNLAADLLEGKDVGWQQVASIRDNLRGTGFYDSSPRAAPGHSYFRLAEFLSDPDRIVGYEEQYAAGAAVMMRTAQLPARVVVGYLVPADRWSNGAAEVRAGDISAWVEVDVEGRGWVPVDVTPDRTRTPTADQQGTVFEDVAVPNPPPPPQLPPNVEVITDDDQQDEPADEPDDKDDSNVSTATGWGTAQIIVGSGLGFVLLVGLVLGTIVLVKRRRTVRRRRAALPAHRVAGAWLDLEDRCREAGVPMPQQVTPLEAARAYFAAEPSATEVRDDMMALVASVDRAAYHSEPPDDEHADKAWQYSDRVVDALVRDRSASRRLKMRIDPRTLRHRDPLASRTKV